MTITVIFSASPANHTAAHLTTAHLHVVGACSFRFTDAAVNKAIYLSGSHRDRIAGYYPVITITAIHSRAQRAACYQHLIAIRVTGSVTTAVHSSVYRPVTNGHRIVSHSSTVRVAAIYSVHRALIDGYSIFCHGSSVRVSSENGIGVCHCASVDFNCIPGCTAPTGTALQITDRAIIHNNVIVIRCTGGNAAIDIAFYCTAINRYGVILRFFCRARAPACGNAAWQFCTVFDSHRIAIRRAICVLCDAAIHFYVNFTVAAYFDIIIVCIPSFTVAAVNRIASAYRCICHRATGNFHCVAVRVAGDLFSRNISAIHIT